MKMRAALAGLFTLLSVHAGSAAEPGNAPVFVMKEVLPKPGIPNGGYSFRVIFSDSSVRTSGRVFTCDDLRHTPRQQVIDEVSHFVMSRLEGEKVDLMSYLAKVPHYVDAARKEAAHCPLPPMS